MNLRGLLCRQRHTHPVLRIPLPLPLRNCGNDISSPNFLARNRFKQPNWPKLRRRQNLLPPLLLLQRPTWFRSSTYCPDFPGTIFSEPPRRPRQLHPRQPHSDSPSHQARMIFPICLRHPAIYSKQARRCFSPSSFNSCSYISTYLTHIQTAKSDLPTIYTIPLLTAYCRRYDPYLNWRHASRTPIHHHRTNRVPPLLLSIPCSSPHSRVT